MELTVGTSAVGPDPLSFPDHHLRRIVVQTTEMIRWTAAESAPPAADFGMKLDELATLVYDGPIQYLKFIRDASAGADATVTLHYFGIS